MSRLRNCCVVIVGVLCLLFHIHPEDADTIHMELQKKKKTQYTHAHISGQAESNQTAWLTFPPLSLILAISQY